MRTSPDTSQPQSGRVQATGTRSDGFSLLEVLIAIAILSLSISVVALAVAPMIERRQARLDVQEVSQTFREARYLAMLERRHVDFQQFAIAELPEAEAIASDILIYANGLCSGRNALVDINGTSVALTLGPTTCEPVSVTSVRQ